VELIRDASEKDLPALRELYARSALSNDRDRTGLLADPDLLEYRQAAGAGGRGSSSTMTAPSSVSQPSPWLRTESSSSATCLWTRPHGARRRARTGLRCRRAARQRGARCIEVTATADAARFYEKAGSSFERSVETRCGPAPRMRMDLAF
jgi:hypothetical protein